MFKIKCTFTIAAAHKLNLPYESKCSALHGHNWKATAYCASTELNENGMVVDFTEIKRKVQDVLDHKNLNDIEGIGYISENCLHSVEVLGYCVNPTAERLAEWICHQIPSCYRVDVQESEGNVATYEDDSMEV